MAITINVTGNAAGGGGSQQQNNQQQTTQSQQLSSGGALSDSYYKRPDYQQYSNQAPQSSGSSIPTNDLIIQDIRREMASRGVVLVPGTSNFSTMMNAIRMQQRNAIIDRIDASSNIRMGEVDLRKDALMQEVSGRVEAARQEALSKTNDPLRQADINRYYNSQMKKELGAVDKFFAGQYKEIEQQAQSEKNEVEQRLTEAIQRLTEELSRGNEDSYLNNLRSKYQQAVKRRDDAATEEEAAEASREAAKIQERMQRVMGGGALSSVAMRGITTAAGMTMMGLSGMFNYLHQRDDMAWNLGIEQAGSILSGNAFNAIRQRNMREIAMNEGIGQTVGGVLGSGLGLWGGMALGGKIGASGGPWGAVLGAILGAVGGAVGSMAGKETTYYLLNRPKLRENAQVGAADLWRQEEQRMLQFNDLAMLTRGDNPYMQFTRNWYINQSQDPLLKGLMNGEFGNQSKPIVDAAAAFNPYNKEGLDLYDLGYTSPEFAQKAAQRIRQRGFVREDSINNALYADALERVFSLSSGALGQLSAYDRFGRNNANQDFANLATTLASLGTTGMQEGAWARSDEFAGYLGQLQSSQRGTFLTVDNQRAARQIATGQALFGDKFGSEAMQAIQAVNNQVQNPGQGFTRTLLYDVIQELYPDTRGDLRKIQMAMYDPSKQNEIQKAFAKRVASIYGSPDTTTGFLAFKEIYGIENPNLLNPIAQQMVSGGGLEAKGLKTANQEELVKPIAQGGYTPEVTKNLNIAADSQMSALLNRMEDMVKISNALLKVLSEDTNDTLKKALDELKNI